MSLSTVDGNELNSFLMDFAEVVTQSDFSTFPLDLKTFNNIIDKIFKYAVISFIMVCSYCYCHTNTVL